MFADIPSQVSATDIGIWVLCLFAVLSMIKIAGEVGLGIYKFSRPKKDSEQYVSRQKFDTLQTTLQATLATFATKADFADLKQSMDRFASRDEVRVLREQIEKVDAYLHAGMHELKNDLHQNTLKTERALTLIEANFPPAAPGPGPVRGRGRARRDDS